MEIQSHSNLIKFLAWIPTSEDTVVYHTTTVNDTVSKDVGNG